LFMKKNVVRSGGSLYPGGRIGCRHPQALEVILPTYPFGDGLSASLAMSLSRGFKLTLHLRSTFPAFPSPPPRRGWQGSEHCPQSFAPRISRQHVWVGTPGHHGARSGSWSPSSILLHEPYEVQRMYVRSPPGRKRHKAGHTPGEQGGHTEPGVDHEDCVGLQGRSGLRDGPALQRRFMAVARFGP
jgi:hypothetical protein